jgi:NitT/TauT family transport system substrate-binding protein
MSPPPLAWLLLPLLAACSDGERVRALRIGMNPWPGYAHLAVTQECGFFAEQDLAVQIVEYASLHDLRRGFSAGQIDVLPSTMIEVLGLRGESGPQPAVVWVADASEGGDQIVARGCRELADLRGKRIAYEPATLGAYLLRRALDLSGIAPDAVEAIGMDQVHMEQALADGRIDAAITYPPFAQRMLAVPGNRSLFSSAAIPGEVVDTISIERSLLERDPTLLARFHTAMAATDRRLREQPHSINSMIARVAGMTPDEFAAARTGVVVYTAADQRDWLVSEDRLGAIAARLGPALGLPTTWSPPPLLAPGIARSPLLSPAQPR